MQRRPTTVVAIGFVVALLAVGVPYWLIPYEKLALPNSLLHAGLVVVVLAAAVVRFFGRVPFWPSVLAIGLAAPCAVVLRIVVGVLGDPTSHNLWPFEVVLAAAVGFGVSLCGALLGSVFMMAMGRRDDDAR